MPNANQLEQGEFVVNSVADVDDEIDVAVGPVVSPRAGSEKGHMGHAAAFKFWPQTLQFSDEFFAV